MNNLLIISFDLVRDGEIPKPLAISSILSFLKKDERYNIDFCVDHLSIDMFDVGNSCQMSYFDKFLATYSINNYNYIALSAYIWNEYLTNDLISYLRTNFEFRGDFILGGYQISYSGNPEIEYPDCQYFINGYAEKSILDILVGNVKRGRINSTVDFSTIPSPYLTKELVVNNSQRMVRLETKRGCPYRCTFCAHRDLTYNKVHKRDLDKVFEEISLFDEFDVQKINIIDPIFNAGKEYLSVMREMRRINLASVVSVQSRFETIIGANGMEFLELCEDLNFNLEFGLQTAILNESQMINRKNNPIKIEKVLKDLNERGINYEISLIYGLPTQSLDSFKYSIDFVLNNGCTNLTAFPLMLLKGTELYQQKSIFGFREESIGEFNIPVVVESNSFTEKDWYEMRSIANSLIPNDRI